MTSRPPALRPDLVDRLRSWSAGAAPRPVTRTGVTRRLAAPLRRVVVRLVDPSVQASLDQLRHDAAALEHRGTGPPPADVEVLRAELRTAHEALVELGLRLAAVERALADKGP